MKSLFIFMLTKFKWNEEIPMSGGFVVDKERVY